jgi:hypothetical protein
MPKKPTRVSDEVQNMTAQQAKDCVFRNLAKEYPKGLIEVTLESVWKEGLERNLTIAEKLEELRNKKTNEITDTNKANFVAMAYNRAIHLFTTIQLPIFSGEQSRFYKIYDKYYIGEGIAANIDHIIEELKKVVKPTGQTPEEVFKNVYGFSQQDVTKFVDAGFTSLEEIPLEVCTPLQQAGIRYYEDLLKPLDDLDFIKMEIQRWFPEQLTFTPRGSLLFVASKLKEDQVMNILLSKPELVVVGPKTKLFAPTLMRINGTVRKISFSWA